MKSIAFDKKVPWALVMSAFINKSGEMAINLLPMLLIERNISTSSSSVILGLTKAAQMGGLFLGGLFTDLFGFRSLILCSYLAGAVGFTVLPFLKSILPISFFAVFAQFGASLFNASSRAMIRERGGAELKKNMAWLRTSSNLGQVVSSTFGILFGTLGLIFPFLLDGATSLIAFAISWFTLKNPTHGTQDAPEAAVQKGYFTYSFLLAFFFFISELGFLSFAGFGKLELGSQSIRAFSVVLLVNTFLCGFLAVPAAHFIKRPKLALFLGVILEASGMILLTELPKTIFYFGLCSLVLTSGEIIFSVFAQTLLLANSSGKSSKHYGFSLMIQALGRLGAGVCLFPLVLRAEHPSLPFLGALAGFMLIFTFVPREFFQRGQ